MGWKRSSPSIRGIGPRLNPYRFFLPPPAPTSPFSAFFPSFLCALLGFRSAIKEILVPPPRRLSFLSLLNRRVEIPYGRGRKGMKEEVVPVKRAEGGNPCKSPSRFPCLPPSRPSFLTPSAPLRSSGDKNQEWRRLKKGRYCGIRSVAGGR